MRTNETITLFKGMGGLQVDVSRMVWNGDDTNGLPSWEVLFFSATDIAAAISGADMGRTVIFTEDDFEVFLKGYLERKHGRMLDGFRWLWDKVREFNAVA